jgi:peroxiredoxin
VEKLHLNYPVVMGNAKLGERYGGVLGVPVTFLIDRAGVVRARFDGEEHLGCGGAADAGAARAPGVLMRG